MDNIAVLLMAYGTPDKISEIKVYLTDIFGGKTPDQKIITAIQSRYEQINFSPLTKITSMQADIIKKEIELKGIKCDVFIGMKHWKPKIEETAEKISKQTYENIIGLIAHPFKSIIGSEEYRERFLSSLPNKNTIFIDSWYKQQELIDAWIENIKKAVVDANLNRFHFIFTSHGLPVSVNDTEYVYELNDFITKLADKLKITDYSLAFQNGEHKDWTQPEVTQKIKELAANGKKDFIIVPIGYISESLETLYDIDITYSALAKALGLNMVRVKSLDLSQKLIDAMVSAIISVI